MYVYYNLSADEFIEMFEALRDFDPCYLDASHECNNCGKCL